MISEIYLFYVLYNKPMYLCIIQPMFKYRVSPKILPSYPNPWADFGIENIFFYY